MITADHGCDPSAPLQIILGVCSLVAYGSRLNPVLILGQESFGDIAATILETLDIPSEIAGDSFYSEMVKGS